MKIGFLDSGVGGWSVLRACLGAKNLFQTQSKKENKKAHEKRDKRKEIIYLADFANLPYGNKDIFELKEILEKNLSWFEEKKVDLLILACNTSSSLLLRFNTYFLSRFPSLKILNLVTESEKYLQNNFQSMELKKLRLLVFSTKATALLGAYQECLSPYFQKLTSFAAEELASLIEEYLLDPLALESKGSLLLSKYREQVYSKEEEKEKEKEEKEKERKKRKEKEEKKKKEEREFDSLLLGCTHYPLLRAVFRRVFPEVSLIVDPAQAIKETLRDEFFSGSLEELGEFELSFLSTDPGVDLEEKIIKYQRLFSEYL